MACSRHFPINEKMKKTNIKKYKNYSKIWFHLSHLFDESTTFLTMTAIYVHWMDTAYLKENKYVQYRNQ